MVPILSQMNPIHNPPPWALPVFFVSKRVGVGSQKVLLTHLN
jgi:hypothetical protein